MKIENLIYKMLTTSTGTALCDSGGESGRNWQRNQKLSLADFKARSEATIELSLYKDEAYASAHIDVFHYLCQGLSLDKVCDEFNKKKVADWEGDIHGVSKSGQQWINERFNYDGEAFNTYNWDCPLSQTLQGCNLTHNETGESYVLLQIHQGADVRGGYTDAKLFKLENPDSFLLCDLSCEHFTLYSGDCVNHDGDTLDKKQLHDLAISLGITIDNSIEIPASILN